MKFKQFIILSLAGFFIGACSNKYVLSKEQRVEAYKQFIEQEQLTEVDRIRSFRLSGWSALGDNHMIINASPSRPYLITFRNRCSNLDYVNGILINQRGSMLESRFDYITTIDTVKSDCYIDTIHQLTKEQKKSLMAIGKNKEKVTKES